SPSLQVAGFAYLQRYRRTRRVPAQESGIGTLLLSMSGSWHSLDDELAPAYFAGTGLPWPVSFTASCSAAARGARPFPRCHTLLRARLNRPRLRRYRVGHPLQARVARLGRPAPRVPRLRADLR